jgi:hypothetical protein
LFKLTVRPPQYTPLFHLPPQMKAENIATLYQAAWGLQISFPWFSAQDL